MEQEHRSTCVISGSASESSEQPEQHEQPEQPDQPGQPQEVFDRLSDERLEALTLDIKTHMDVAHAWHVHAAAEMDRRQVAERRHVLSTRQWLCRFARMPKSAAGALARTARSLSEFPTTMKRSLAGEIPAESLRKIAAARHRHPDEFPLHEETFADIASYLDPKDLQAAIRYWEQQVDHAAALDDIEHRTERRRMSLHQTVDGMWHHEGLHDPESGHTIATALRAYADPGNLDDADTRSHGQRMADGLTEVCRFWLDHNETAATSAGEKPHITLAIDPESVMFPAMPGTSRQHEAVAHDHRRTLPLPEIADTPVAPETVRRIICDSSVFSVVVDEKGQPLDVGRRIRTVPPAIRRALDLRDGGCAWDGCDAPLGWCDAHHITHWASGGRTSLDNLVLLCRRHHTAVHEGRRPIGRSPGVPRPDG